MLLLGQTQQAYSQERALVQVKGTLQFLGCQPLGLSLPLSARHALQVDDGQGQQVRVGNDLHRLRMYCCKARAKRFMPSHHLSEALLQSSYVERADQANSS